MNVEDESTIQVIKVNNVLLEENVKNSIYISIENKINFNSIAALNCLSKLVKNTNSFKKLLEKLHKSSMRYTERNFKTIADSRDFLELDFKHVIRILSSDELNIDSELEVTFAADEWLSHDILERGKFAKRLLLRVRLHLLSDPALKHVLEQTSCFSADEDCVVIIKNYLGRNKDSMSGNSLVAARCCKQPSFDFLFCGGIRDRRYVGDVFAVGAGQNFNNIKHLAKIKERQKTFKAVCVRDEVYLLPHDAKGKSNALRSVEKYSLKTNRWQFVAETRDERELFCACSFADDVYVIGGRLRGEETGSCLKFNTKSATWREATQMSEARCYADCAVFQGRIVVTGGSRGENIRDGSLGSVEAYDHVGNTWTRMPSMIRRRCLHKVVSMGTKLYVIGGYRQFEVFDSVSNKFALVSHSSQCLSRLPDLPVNRIYLLEDPFSEVLTHPAEVFIMGNKLVVFGNSSWYVYFYDVESGEWTDEQLPMTYSLYLYCGTKVPHGY